VKRYRPEETTGLRGGEKEKKGNNKKPQGTSITDTESTLRRGNIWIQRNRGIFRKQKRVLCIKRERSSGRGERELNVQQGGNLGGLTAALMSGARMAILLGKPCVLTF